MRTSVYIDGFNLYYRALRGTPYKWLDLKQLAANLLQPKHVITEIKYFTAIVSGIFDPRQPIRQKTYIRALESYIPEVSVHYGHFLSHTVSLPQSPLAQPPSFAKVIKTEEKGSDVNLAVHLLNDAWLDKYDCAIVISNDSDLAEPLRLIREQNGKLLGLLSPLVQGHPSQELQKHAHFVKRIRKGVLKVSQLPSTIPGTNITKPPSW
ncbi:conserved hypothetical protein [Desulfatibacillum aliphaticivorans]|uniref:NYN domain-containing protein n=1 Tax=Desulfatibacillum aliphaticivorans TaxID=218208 RepID=B8FIP1_DESAL|nr:NYN domain-containing protein [Desulfatibacillum aliphaticivorans]ACL04282.1 conserved hypothetical protein [Desulfatibacillum aliphaticivorans]